MRCHFCVRRDPARGQELTLGSLPGPPPDCFLTEELGIQRLPTLPGSGTATAVQPGQGSVWEVGQPCPALAAEA